jgi:preprotein translocase subunit SecD
MTIAAPSGVDVVTVRSGLGLAAAEQLYGTDARLAFATAAAGAPPAAASTSADFCEQYPSNSFCVDQEDLYDPSQLDDTQYYPSGYHWKIDNNVTAADISSSSLGTDSNGNPAVDITFNSAGAAEWGKLTQAAYNVYNTDNCAIGTSCPATAQVAIFRDTDVISAPIVEGVSGSATEITGLTLSEAQVLSEELTAGALPVGVQVASSVSASPSPAP